MGNNNNSIERIVCAIQINSSRMEKLSSMSDVLARRRKAKAYVVAECAAQRIKLNEHDIVYAAVMLAG